MRLVGAWKYRSETSPNVAARVKALNSLSIGASSRLARAVTEDAMARSWLLANATETSEAESTMAASALATVAVFMSSGITARRGQ